MQRLSARAPESDRSEQDLAECQRLLVDGSRSFLAASRILPRDVARSASALYAFCRLADDRVDGSGAAHAAAGGPGCGPRGALAELHDRLDGIYAGVPQPFAADRAFAAVVVRHHIPRAWPRALLEGFAWDAAGRQYEDLAQLRAYAARVAGSVGAMMARVMGVHTRAIVARACELGVAMQLTNIARDVGEDARLGRLYLPRGWMREAGIDPDAWLARPAFTPALGAVVQRVLDAAWHSYQGGATGIAHLPLACRPGIRAAAMLYADIGRSVRRRAGDSISARAIVAPARKAQLVAWAALASLSSSASTWTPAPPEIDFLLDAAGLAPAPAGAPATTFDSVLQIFERLERRDRECGAGFAAAGAPRARA